MKLKEFVEFLSYELEVGEKGIDKYEVVVKTKNKGHVDITSIEFKDIKVDLTEGQLILDVVKD